ncbi:hypothetical protein B0E33_15090 [Roseibium algicola]|uniref:ParD-like antitoxin of type II ParDE toxin-antitoxin system n=1 Tax=Roseibium algicola TaxID=2857014 RepID=A0ABN4WSM6_9HYPH|nr:hypothetical protein [Roseibium aggregatum]AQQ04729.1 hypothetical protein B0E33_15090 [Roseibium aggregatum]
MAKSVKFTDDTFVDDARVMAELHSRSVAGQIMHWARVGRAIERFGRFDQAKICRVLSGEMETSTLTAEEKAVWSERFLEKISEPGPDEEAYYAELRKNGNACRLDASGNNVRTDFRPEK